jgi:hypothetical protein
MSGNRTWRVKWEHRRVLSAEGSKPIGSQCPRPVLQTESLATYDPIMARMERDIIRMVGRDDPIAWALLKSIPGAKYSPQLNAQAEAVSGDALSLSG